MSETPPNPELMRSLGKLVRGLSALFWGLPASLVVCFHTAKAEDLRGYAMLPPIICTGLLLYGLLQLAEFQPQERVWRNALDRATVLAMLMVGLSPFLFWWNRIPANFLFWLMVMALAISGLLFLVSLNLVLQRLVAMLPDEALRHETRQFTGLNLNLLLATVLLIVFFTALRQFSELPQWLRNFEFAVERGSFWLLVLLVLLPMALTMALIWKTKEVILEGIFAAKR